MYKGQQESDLGTGNNQLSVKLEIPFKKYFSKCELQSLRELENQFQWVTTGIPKNGNRTDNA